MGACGSAVSSYSAWLCGYGVRTTDGISYTDMNGDPVNIDDFLSDDELLGLDEHDVLTNRRRAGGRTTMSSSRRPLSPNSTDIASPYGDRPLVLHSDHFQPSRVGAGLDTSTASDVSSGDVHLGATVTHGGRQPVAATARGHQAAQSTADVMQATHDVMSLLEQRPSSTSTSAARVPSVGVSDASSRMSRSHGIAPAASSLAAVAASSTSASIPRHGTPAQALKTEELVSGQELTSWIDNPEELRALHYDQGSDPVGPEDFDEFLNSVIARSLSGQSPVAHGDSARALSPNDYDDGTAGVSVLQTSGDVSYETVHSDTDDGRGLVVGAGGQILPAWHTQDDKGTAMFTGGHDHYEDLVDPGEGEDYGAGSTRSSTPDEIEDRDISPARLALQES